MHRCQRGRPRQPGDEWCGQKLPAGTSSFCKASTSGPLFTGDHSASEHHEHTDHPHNPHKFNFTPKSPVPCPKGPGFRGWAATVFFPEPDSAEGRLISVKKPLPGAQRRWAGPQGSGSTAPARQRALVPPVPSPGNEAQDALRPTVAPTRSPEGVPKQHANPGGGSALGRWLTAQWRAGAESAWKPVWKAPPRLSSGPPRRLPQARTPRGPGPRRSQREAQGSHAGSRARPRLQAWREAASRRSARGLGVPRRVGRAPPLRTEDAILRVKGPEGHVAQRRRPQPGERRCPAPRDQHATHAVPTCRPQSPGDGAPARRCWPRSPPCPSGFPASDTELTSACTKEAFLIKGVLGEGDEDPITR